MRLIQISVPDAQRETVVEVLREQGVGFTEASATGETTDHTLVNIAVPADAVEHVLNELYDAGVDERTYTVSLETEFAIFEGMDELQEKWANTPNSIAPRTLRAKAKGLQLNNRSYLWMMFLSTVVATAGLLLNSPAIVVGSMVLAPLVSPILTASVGGVRNDREMVISSIFLQALGLGVAVVGAILLAASIRYLGVVPGSFGIRNVATIGGRIAPSILAAAVALASGAAAAFGLASKGDVSIVGVMIAAALIPSAATAGIGIAWGEFVVGAGALLLLALNVVLVNVSGFATLWYLGYRPDDIDTSVFDVGTREEMVTVGTTVLVVGLVVVGVGVGFAFQSSFEHTVNGVVAETLAGEDYPGLAVEGTTVEYTAPGPLEDGPVMVTLQVARTADRSYPDLPNVLDRRISERTGREVTVEITYVDYHRSDERLTRTGEYSARSRSPDGSLLAGRPLA